MAIRIAVEMGLPAAIVAGKGEAVIATELARKSGADVRLVGEATSMEKKFWVYVDLNL